MYMFCGVFVEDKKLDSNLHIWPVTQYFCDFCSASQIRLLVIKTNGLFLYEITTIEWFDIFSQNALRESIR